MRRIMKRKTVEIHPGTVFHLSATFLRRISLARPERGHRARAK
jgi:hypothetical protein